MRHLLAIRHNSIIRRKHPQRICLNLFNRCCKKQQSKTQVIEVLLKELNELRSRVKNLEELSQQRAQQQTLEMPSIQIPIRLDITTNDQDTSQNVGVGKATKKIRITKRKC